MTDTRAHTPRLSRRSILFGAAACMSTGLLGCGKLTALAETLLGALASADWANLLTIASPELLKELDEERFRQLSAEYRMLGPLRDHSRTGIGTRNGAEHLDYTLQFDAGTVSMQVISRDDRLDGFALEGPAWVGACDKLHQQRLVDLLDALEHSDLPGAREVVHADIGDADLQRLFGMFKGLGARRSARYLGFEGGRKIELEYEHAKLGGEIGMRGGKLGYFEFHAR